MSAQPEPSPRGPEEPTGRTALFSIVIAVKDGEDTIHRAVSSVLGQTYPRVEAVIVVNGTTDATTDVLKRFRDPRVRVIELPDPGRSRARNVGRDAAKGEYLIFLDADDELLPSKVGNAWALLGDGFDAVQAATLYEHPNGRLTTLLPYQGHNFVGRLHLRNTIPINSMALRRDICGSFPEDSEYCEDWEFWLRTLPGLRIGSYPIADCVVHIHEGNTSRDLMRMRSYQIPIYVHHRPPRIPLWWRLTRAYQITLALIAYANEVPIPAVEQAVQESRPVKAAIETLRHMPWLSRLGWRLIRLRLRISRLRPPTHRRPS